MKIRIYYRQWMAIAFALMLVIGTSAAVAADADNARPAVKKAGVIKMRAAEPSMAMDVGIAEKTDGMVITETGYIYPLSAETIILDVNGARQTIATMWVPCRADISYVIADGHRKAIKIQLKKVGHNATTRFKQALSQ